MNLRTTPEGIALIKQFEGCKLKAYRCPAGIWTIGYGLTTGAIPGVTVSAGMRITQQQAEDYLLQAVDIFEDKVERLLGAKLDELEPHQFDALVAFAYNVGVGKKKPASGLAGSTLFRRVMAGDFDKVPAEFMKWNKAGGRVLPGLTRRRSAEAALWSDHRQVAQAFAQVHEEDEDEDMPQEVDAPSAKGMGQSKIGNTAIGAGGLGLLSPAVDGMDKIQEAVDKGKDFTQVLGDLAPYGILAIVIIAAAIFIWVERDKLMKRESV